jgi:hypothetical protein
LIQEGNTTPFYYPMLYKFCELFTGFFEAVSQVNSIHPLPVPFVGALWYGHLEWLHFDILPTDKSGGFQLSLVGFPASLKLAFSLAVELSSGSYGLSAG